MHFFVDTKVQTWYFPIMQREVISELKTTRKSFGITQKEAAAITGVSLRSYKEYENNPFKEGSFKYEYLLEKLNKLYLIDEDHGILSLETIKEKCREVFSLYDVEFCYLFGSYSRGEAKETSDVDLLISTSVTGMDFYGIAERLRIALKKKVDLLDMGQLKNNTELQHEILKDGVRIYEQPEKR